MLGEVSFKPIEDRGEVEDFVFEIDLVFRGISEERAGLFIELCVQVLGSVGFVQEWWAADGGAVYAEVYSWVTEVLAQDGMFDFIEASFFSESMDERFFPRGGKILNAFEWVVVYNEFECGSVV